MPRRWQAVRDRLSFDSDPSTELEDPVPAACPASGYIGRLKNYPHPFGIWLMPDCASDGKKLEHLVATLIPQDDPLWPHAVAMTAIAATSRNVND